MNRRPNILLVTTDQQRADHVGCYGNAVVRTPHIDGLAARGRRFTRFYVACAICMPNRSTLMTGRMPSLHGVRCNGIPLSRRATTFVDLLRAAGYHTALIGKCHLQNMTGQPAEMVRPPAVPGLAAPPQVLADAERERWSDGSYDEESLARWKSDVGHRVATPYYGFEHVELCTLHGDMVHGDYDRWLRSRVADPDALRGPRNALPDNRITVPQAYRTRIPEELYPTSYVAERTLEFLDAAARERDRPFFLHCSFADPHHPFTPPGRYWDAYDPDTVPVPPSLLAAGERSIPPVAALHRQRQAGGARTSSTTPFAVSAREAREAIALTYGMITMIDDAVGRIVARLREHGLDQDTVIVFTSDHGDFMGDHGIMLKGALHYQGLVRVPFIWSEPRLAQPGSATPALAGTLDIAATILERAALAPYDGMQGQSLLPLVRGTTTAGRRAILIEEDGHAPAFGMTGPLRARTVITDRYRLSVYSPVDWVELYDLADDPHELTNLAEAASHRTIRADLHELMAKLMFDLTDQSPFPPGRA